MFSLSVGILVISSGMSSADWGPAVNLGPNVNTITHEVDPSISSDGTKLYFASLREGGYGGADIWVSEYKDNSWQPPINLGPNINDSFYQYHPSISSNGMKLYLDNGCYIFESSYSDGSWQPPNVVELGMPQGIRSFAPCISQDSTKLYFTSMSDNMWNIWVSEYGDTSWQPATMLGPNINTKQWEACPSISSDGTRLYFCAMRGGGYGGYDIWVSEWEEKVEESEKPNTSESSHGVFQTALNPSIRLLTINYHVPVSGWVTLKIYNNAGNLVRALINEMREEGNYTIKWDGTDETGIQVPAGTYFYQLKVGEYTSAKVSVILR
ncbi:MAG: FlgD immunoglobulin-like domain containing protein [bacterium]|nr:FlgD immunoglobulin-like domain containing protein [bacterium]